MRPGERKKPLKPAAESSRRWPAKLLSAKATHRAGIAAAATGRVFRGRVFARTCATASTARSPGRPEASIPSGRGIRRRLEEICPSSGRATGARTSGAGRCRVPTPDHLVASPPAPSPWRSSPVRGIDPDALDEPELATVRVDRGGPSSRWRSPFRYHFSVPLTYSQAGAPSRWRTPSRYHLVEPFAWITAGPPSRCRRPWRNHSSRPLGKIRAGPSKRWSSPSPSRHSRTPSELRSGSLTVETGGVPT